MGEDPVGQAFYTRCEGVESMIRLRAAAERRMNIDNYDSGFGVEDLVREELGNLLPRRYSVRAGVLSDRLGRTAGDCDIIIFNDAWFPAVKSGATQASRRWHFPVEGSYAAVEVKQSLTATTLDDAMQKVVTASRLHRPWVSSARVVENRELADSSCVHDVVNPLFTAVIATDLGPGVSLDEIAERFIALNRLLARHEVVNSLCVLGNIYMSWAYRDAHQELRPARFRLDDSGSTLMPARVVAAQDRSVLYEMVVSLFAHLYGSTLAAEDIAAVYGSNRGIQLAEDPALCLPPDPG